MTAADLAATLAEMEIQARKSGAAAREVFDGYGQVWLEANRTSNGRVTWTVEERRIARAQIPDRLLSQQGRGLQAA